MDQLSPERREALTQLRILTNGGDDDVSISVLSSVDWDVQRAADLIFGGTGTGSAPEFHEPPRRSFTGENRLEVDDSQVDHTTHVTRRRSTNLLPRWSSLLGFLSLPIHILSSVLRFFFSILRIPIPQLRFTNLNFYRPLRPTAPESRGGVERWVRDLEEETGAIRVSRNGTQRAATTSGVDPGPSNLTARGNGAAGSPSSVEGRKSLPDFMLGSYEDALRICQRDARIGCIVLVSEEHDDVTEFKWSTLTDPSFVKLLSDNDMVVWGGDVRDREPWSAAQKLQATTYPFVAFMALQPRRNLNSSGSSRSSSPPTLTVLSRHQGKCIPASGPTSAKTLIDHLEQQLLPRVNPFLERIRSVQKERERERLLREQQDRAFQDSARRDVQRIEAKIALERQIAEQNKLAEDRAMRDKERKATEAKERLASEAARMEWRRWARRALVAPTGQPAGRSLPIAIRMLGDRRIIRNFPPTATLTSLYTFVDTQLIPVELSPDGDPRTPPDAAGSGEEAVERQILLSDSPDHWWGFKLVLVYPRRDIIWEANVKLADVEQLRGGAQLVVEMFESQRKGRQDDEEYLSDESE